MSPSRRHHLAFLVLWLSLILTTSFYAHEKAFWFDEILTLGIASTEPGPPMWQAMTAGFEFNPPLPYLAMHVAESLLGRGEFRSRLPFLLASWLAVLLLHFAFLRQGSPAAGLWAIYLWLHTDALSYFYEARSYAFVFLGATLLLVSWSLRRPLARTLGLYAGLLIALLAHMWALVLLPVLGFFVLEALWRERRLDWPPALALLAATPTLALYPPLVSATRGVRFLNPIYQGELLPLYHEVLDNLPFVLFLLLLTGLLRGLPLALPPAPLQRFSALLLAAPLLVFTGTRLSGSPFMERYVLLASLGAAMALAPLLAGSAPRVFWSCLCSPCSSGIAITPSSLPFPGSGRSLVPSPVSPSSPPPRLPYTSPAVSISCLFTTTQRPPNASACTSLPTVSAPFVLPAPMVSTPRSFQHLPGSASFIPSRRFPRSRPASGSSTKTIASTGFVLPSLRPATASPITPTSLPRSCSPAALGICRFLKVYSMWNFPFQETDEQRRFD